MLVSAIMPTADRRRFIPDAIRRFLAQDYPEKELVILDDGDDPIGDLAQGDPRLRYAYAQERRILGDVRNRCCEMARGEVIVHWDDDDYYAPWRISHQVNALNGCDICGLARPLFYDETNDSAWEHIYESPPPWVYGSTFAYTKAIWRTHPFEDRQDGEDTRFVSTLAEHQVRVLDDQSMYVGLRHGANTGYHPPLPCFRNPIPVSRIKEIMGEDSFCRHSRDAA